MSWLLQSHKNGYARLHKYHGLEDLEPKLTNYIPPGKIQQNVPLHPVVIPKLANHTSNSLRPLSIIPIELDLTSKNSEASRKHLEAKQTFQNFVQELKIDKDWSPPITSTSQNINNNVISDDEEPNDTIFGNDSPKLFDFEWKPEFDDLLPDKENIAAYIKASWKVKVPKIRTKIKHVAKYTFKPALPPPMETDDLTIYAPVVDSDPPWKQIPRPPVNIAELIRASRIRRTQSVQPPPKSPERSYQPLPRDIIPQIFQTKSRRSQSMKPLSTIVKVEKLIPKEIRRCYEKPWLLNKVSKVTHRSKNFKPNKPKPQEIAAKIKTQVNQPLNSILKTKEPDPPKQIPKKKKKSTPSTFISNDLVMGIRHSPKSKLKTMKPIRPMLHELHKYQAPKTAQEIYCRRQPPFSYASINKAPEELTTKVATKPSIPDVAKNSDNSPEKPLTPLKSTEFSSNSSVIHRNSIEIPSKDTVAPSQCKVTHSKDSIPHSKDSDVPPSTASGNLGPSWASEVTLSNGSVSLPAIKSHNPLSRVAASQSINITNTTTSKKLIKPSISKTKDKDEITKKVEESQMFSKEWIAYIKLKKKLEKKEQMKRKLQLLSQSASSRSRTSRSTTPAH